MNTNPVNERGETFEEYQARVMATPSVQTAPTSPPVQVTEDGVLYSPIEQMLAYDPAFDAMRQRLLQLEQIATKHYLENINNRQQVRELVRQRERTARKLEKAKIYRQELKRIHAKHRLTILELDAMKRRYDNLQRLGVADSDAEYSRGREDGYQVGFYDGQQSRTADGIPF